MHDDDMLFFFFFHRARSEQYSTLSCVSVSAPIVFRRFLFDDRGRNWARVRYDCAFNSNLEPNAKANKKKTNLEMIFHLSFSLMIQISDERYTRKLQNNEEIRSITTPQVHFWWGKLLKLLFPLLIWFIFCNKLLIMQSHVRCRVRLFHLIILSCFEHFFEGKRFVFWSFHW